MKNNKFSMSGNGWSGAEGVVHIVDAYVEGQSRKYGEFRVFFDSTRWIVNEDGLIYGDTGFLASLKSALMRSGMSIQAIQDIEYSEHGMQGDDYVSFDVGPDFLADWHASLGQDFMAA